MALRRKMYEELLAWRKNPAKKALLLTGARQIGKSYLIRELARNEYASYVEINLYENERARNALAQARGLDDLLRRISLFSDTPLTPGKSLVFIDEVQELPDIMTMAKFLVQDGRFDYAFSGSMLGTEFRGVRSFPVGYVTEMTMRPLDFEEFSWATGVPGSIWGLVRKACADRTPIDEFVHAKLMEDWRLYLVVGGMPEVVQLFSDTGGDLGSVRMKQHELNAQYRYDIAKYAGSRVLPVQAIFDQIPTQLNEAGSRFTVSSIAGGRYDRSAPDFLWLSNAGAALKVDQIREPKSPLKRTEQPSKFKLYQSDTGMLVERYPVTLAQTIYLDERSANLGAIYENAVAQELVAQGLAPYYYMTKKRGEVDFFVETDRGALPIEVKSGTSFKMHAALDHVLESPDYGLPEGVVLSRGNVAADGKVLYLPLYATGLLRELNACPLPSHIPMPTW